ncbi:MAG: hypothetical protein KC493_18230, partial [Bacteriovoracaceae bacterium]|nr:hypothetical protein [Bacteriovoracaceae bacterium]
RYYRDMSQREVGDYLEISPARVSQVEKSAKKKLEDSLEKEGLLVA